MRVLVFGANGFIGGNVCDELSSDHEVFRASSTNPQRPNDYHNVYVDLLLPKSIKECIAETKPDAIVNCAGIVNESDGFKNNVVFTKNIIDQVSKDKSIKRIVVMGSASEYGNVSPDQLPVSEDTPLLPVGEYAISKVEEEEAALSIDRSVVLRVFNPIGRGMSRKFLIPNILAQLEEVTKGIRTSVEISRLDSERDYLSVRDVARAVRLIIEIDILAHQVYNVGSGRHISNRELFEVILKSKKIDGATDIIETSPIKEKGVASQADITRIKEDTGWTPRDLLENVIEEITNE